MELSVEILIAILKILYVIYNLRQKYMIRNSEKCPESRVITCFSVHQEHLHGGNEISRFATGLYCLFSQSLPFYKCISVGQIGVIKAVTNEKLC